VNCVEGRTSAKQRVGLGSTKFQKTKSQIAFHREVAPGVLQEDNRISFRRAGSPTAPTAQIHFSVSFESGLHKLEKNRYWARLLEAAACNTASDNNYTRIRENHAVPKLRVRLSMKTPSFY
jgi:hypothetical protein